MSVNRKRKILKTFWLDEQENEWLKLRLEESPFTNLSTYIRECIFQKEIIVMEFEQLEQLNYELNRIGNNVNQIAKVAHSKGTITRDEIEELLTTVQTISSEVGDYLYFLKRKG